jgi:glycosyltransferase involved in cell wall biosynthesis
MRFPRHIATAMLKHQLKHALKGSRRYPFVLMLEPLYTCNLACLGCAVERHTGKLAERLTPAACFKAVDDCGAPFVSICGGGPRRLSPGRIANPNRQGAAMARQINLVTDEAGFIGSAVARHLLERGEAVRVLVRRGSEPRRCHMGAPYLQNPWPAERTGLQRWPIHTRAPLFILMAFEGPDRYAHAGGLGTRVTELSCTLAGQGFETHLCFIGDPALPGYEVRQGGRLHLHRWCQWISAYHPKGVYDGEEGKHADFTRSLPPWLLEHLIRPAGRSGRSVVVMGEDWQTAEALCQLGDAAQAEGLSTPILLLWNANNVFGFHRIPWQRLTHHAVITTVSRYMKHVLEQYGVEALVIPNGIPERWLRPMNPRAVRSVRQVFDDRRLFVKVARWDPEKGRGIALEAAAKLKQLGLQPILLARGGLEPYEADVLAEARRHGLSVGEARCSQDDPHSLCKALHAARDYDVINLKTFLPDESRRVLFRAADAVLANSRMEPFGLVGLETMAVGGIAFTGCAGEDYALHNYNAIVLERHDADEIAKQTVYLARDAAARRRLRQAAKETARRHTWSAILRRVFFPRVEQALMDLTPAAAPS